MLNVATIGGDIVLDNKGFTTVLKQSKTDMAAAALEMQKASRVKFDLAEYKKLSSQMQALKGRAQDVRAALLKATPGSDEAKKLKGELAGLNDRVRLLKAQTEPARQELKRLAQTQKEAAKETSNLDTETRKLAKGGLGSMKSAAMAALAVATAVTGAGVGAVKLGADLEMTEKAFEGLLGSAEEATAFVTTLRDFAEATPFEMPGLLENTRLLMAFGFETQKVIPMLRVVGDAASYFGGGTEQINRIVTSLGQIKAKAKLSAEEMNQLTESGINGWEMVAKAIGVGVPQAMKLAEQGGIDSTTAINAILTGMSERYAGGMKSLSETTTGLWSTGVDTVRNAVSELGKEMADDIKPAIVAITKDFQESWPQIKEELKEFWKETKPIFYGMVEGIKLVITHARELKMIFKGLVPKNVQAIFSKLAQQSAGSRAEASEKADKETDAPEAPPPANDFLMGRDPNAQTQGQLAAVSKAAATMASMRRELTLNGDASAYAAMQWEVLNGQYAQADDATKKQLLAMAQQADAQDAAREAVRDHADEQKRLATESRRTADEMVKSMQDAARRMADSMRSFSDEVVSAVKDQIKREREARDAALDENRARYEKLKEIGRAGAMAMTNVVMFGKKEQPKEITSADFTPDRMQAAAREIVANKQREADITARAQGSLFGNGIARYEAAANQQIPDMNGMSSSQQVGLLGQIKDLISRELQVLERANRPAQRSY